MDLNMPVMNGIDATKAIFALKEDILEGRANQVVEKSRLSPARFLQ
jgi:CheY-like chemotaxis protein